jgi:hypothetical protein
MDPIQPIERRSPWISELAAEQAQGVSRKRRKKPRDADRKLGPRREPPGDRSESGQQGPEEDGPDGRRIDVRA